jgi:hypothetical protein
VPNRYPQSDRSAWWPYIQANIFELSIAVFSLIAAVNYYIQPANLSDSSVGHVAFPDLVWNTLYGFGAFLVAVGLLRLSLRVEAAGLSLLSAAAAINALAIWHYRGSSAAASIAIFIAFFVASIIRLHTIYAGTRRR